MIALFSLLSLLCVVIQQRPRKNDGCRKLDGRRQPPPPPFQQPPIIVSPQSNGPLKRLQQEHAKEKEKDVEEYDVQRYVAEPMELAVLDGRTEGNIYYSL
jgi:hypothetical protein